MGDSLEPADTEAITRAVRLLREPGYQVSSTTDGKPTDEGIGFRLDVEAPTRYTGWKDGTVMGGRDAE